MPIFKASIFILLELFAINTYAETKRYNVEVVIFEDVSSRYINSEQWPVIIHQPQDELHSEALPSEIDEASPDIQLEDSVIIEKEVAYPEDNNVTNVTHITTELLADHIRKLERSSQYNVLLHQSWQQTGLNITDAINIRIDTTEAKNVENNEVIRLNSDSYSTEIDNTNFKSSVRGTLKLILGRYLHIHTDLDYKRLNSAYSSTSPVLNKQIFDEFKIKSQRRMRSNELHYIDHPLVGILILVSPIEQRQFQVISAI